MPSAVGGDKMPVQLQLRQATYGLDWWRWENQADMQLNNMYEESLALSKADRLWRDCLETAASSKDIAVAEELAGYFVSIGNKDAFAAILYVCFELVRPDFVEEMVSQSRTFR